MIRVEVCNFWLTRLGSQQYQLHTIRAGIRHGMNPKHCYSKRTGS